MKTLQERLRIKAGMITLGEKISWGSETALMYEAADKLDAQEKLIDELRAKLAQAQQPTNDEPVAFISHHASGIYVGFEPSSGDAVEVTPLYTRPQPAKVTPETSAVPDEIESELSEIEYKAGYVFKDCHETAHQAIDYMMVQFRAMLKGEK